MSSGNTANGEQETASCLRDEADSRALARAMAHEDVLGHAVDDVQVVETHISVVLLAGDHAYKLRKPVELPFVDFRTLESRRADCERELALNRRWAPDLYEAMVAIHGTRDAPTLEDTGEVLDYAVRMRRFPDSARMDRVVTAGGLDADLAERLARSVAAMHEAAPVASPESGWSRAALVEEQVRGNLEALADTPLEDAERERLERITAFSDDALRAHEARFAARLADGRVRECHGDLHLANVVCIDGEVMPFDGVEFREDFRQVDVISDLAFLLMDLHRLGQAASAWRVLDFWLEDTGDHDGVALLRHYLVYRAMVRAKVEAIRYRQLREADGDADDDPTVAYRDLSRYLALAERLGEPAHARGLVITHGVSGSGKTTLARDLVPALGAVMLRSDVERRRLYPEADGRYSCAATERVYAHLFERAGSILAAGYPVILDATFLDDAPRAAAAALAARCGVPFRILSVTAPYEVLVSRIEARNAAGTDASEADVAVLDAQLREARALPAGPHRVEVDSTDPGDVADIVGALDLARD